MMTPDEVRTKIAERAIGAAGPLDASLPAVGAVGEGIKAVATEAAPEILTPSVLGGTIGGVAGGRFGGQSGARFGSGVGTALGRSVESIAEGEGVTGALTSLPIGFAEGYASEVIGEKASRLWQASKSRFFRKAPVGELPAEGSIFGKAIDDSKELHEYGKFMGRELERDFNALRSAGGKSPLTGTEVERLKKGFFTPAQLTEGDLLDQAEAMGSASMTGGKMRRFKRTRERALGAYAEMYRRSLGEATDDPVTLAKFLKEKAAAVFDDRNTKISAAYERVMDVAGDRMIDLRPARAALQEQVADWEARAALSPDKQKIAPVMARIKRFTQVREDPTTGYFTIESAPLTLRQTQQLRSDWLEMRRMLKDTASKAKGATGSAIKEIDGAIDSVLKKVSAEMGQTGKNTIDRQYRAANFGYGRLKGHMDRLQMDAVTELVDRKKAGAEAIRELFPNGASTRHADLLKNTLGGENSPGWQKVRRWYGDELLNRHMRGGRIGFDGLVDELTQAGEGRLAQIKTVLGDEYFNTLHQFAKVGQAAGRGNPVGDKIAINIAETGALLSLGGASAGLFGDYDAMGGLAGSAVFIPTYTLNRWLANPKTAELVLTGMKGNGGRAFAREMAALLTRTIAEEGTDSMIRPVPKTASRDDLRQMHTPQTSYGGTRG